MEVRGVDPSDGVGAGAPFRELQATVGRLERVLASVPSGLVWIDGTGRIKWCNESFAALTGRERLFVLGQDAAEVLALRRGGEALAGAAHPFIRAIKEKRGLDEVCEAGPADAPRLVRLTGQYAMHDKADPFLSASVLDITAELRASTELNARTAELQEALAEHEAFTYTVAHDLRTPLRSINSFAQILMNDFVGRVPDDAVSLLSRIRASGGRMDQLITDLLAYSRIRKEDIALETLELEPVVDRVLASLADELKGRGAVVTVARPLPAVVGHAGMFVQALSNLLVNAAKFTAPGIKPVIVVRAENRGERTRLWVEDNGIGIEPRFHETVFSVFQRLHGLEEYPGTGIGLAIARRAVARSRGAVGVESEPGVGSRFYIELPAAKAP